MNYQGTSKMIHQLKVITLLSALLLSYNAFCKNSLPDLEKEREKIALKIKLNELRSSDQTIRHEIDRLEAAGYTTSQVYNSPVGKYWMEIDRKNCRELKEILKKFGWPTISVYGEEADNAAWLVAQHADFDHPFQKQVLQLLAKKLKTKEIADRNYGYLLDRVRVNEKKLQVYGTQGYCLKKSLWVPRPMEKPSQVDERRKTLGIEPMSAYEKQVDSYCH